jgi:hypothetical protein
VSQPGVVAGALVEYHAARAKAMTAPGNNVDPTAVFADTGGGGHDGTLGGFAYTTASGWAGTGTLSDPYRLVFDVDYLTMPYVAAANVKIVTYDVWVLFTSTASVKQIMGASAAAGNGYISLRLQSGGYVRFAMGNDAGAAVGINSSLTLNDGTPHHVVATCDGTDMRIFVDGALRSTPTACPTGTLTLNQSALGKDLKTAGRDYPGAIAVARKYGVGFTLADAAQNYAAGPCWAVAPTVTTQAPHKGTATIGYAGGNVISDGNGAVTERGICWSTSPVPTTADSTIASAGTTGAFSSILTGLVEGTRYYVRAYATNVVGTSYGAVESFVAGLPSTAAVTAPPLSLLVGPDTANLYDFAAEATINDRIKAMPGGDTSLTFTLSAPVAAAHRQQLAEGSLVRLRANGVPDFGGKVCNDPCASVLSAIRWSVTVECSGVWAWADRRKDFAWVWNDTDAAMWQRVTQKYDPGAGELIDLEGQGRFTVDTDGRLYIRADKDRAYPASANARIAYWLLGGLETGCEIVGLDVDFGFNCPNLTGGGAGPWEVRWRYCDNPWAARTAINATADATLHADVAKWHLHEMDLAAGAPCVEMQLYRADSSDGPADEVVSDPWVWVRGVTVRCRMDGASVDRDVLLSDALIDMATMPGLATVTDGVLSGVGIDQLAVRPELPKSIRDGMITTAAMASDELEYGFDLDDAGGDRYYQWWKPPACDWTRNSVWHYGDAAGEDAAGLIQDPELCPDWIRLLYLSSGVATVPDGTPQDIWYPATPPVDYVGSVAVMTQYAAEKMSAGDAYAAAFMVYRRIAASLWTGTVPVPFTLTDTRGRVRGGWEVRPGDRLSVPSRAGATDLYVTEPKWNWAALTGEMTVGYPWEIENIGTVGKSSFSHVFVPGRPQGAYGHR